MPIIQSVERALTILDLFNDQAKELKITDISKQMGLSKSTLHSLLKTLQLHGYIDQNPENGKYRLGMKLVERGHFVVGSMDIRQKAKGWLTELSQHTGQTTHLGILDGREGVYIEKIEGRLAAIAYSRIGRRLPVHATAIGKVLIAWLSDAERIPCSMAITTPPSRPRPSPPARRCWMSWRKPAPGATPWTAKRTNRACAAWRYRCGIMNRG